MACEKHFISGTEYRLGRILDNDVKIIIPDLQRDYCWGSYECQGLTLAAKFTQDLLNHYFIIRDSNNVSDLPLGLIYGYEIPSGHLQLCDGQQRITTLYLLLGMLNRKTHTLQDKLISEREIDDDHEPYLQYSIRETTLYFLSDLVRFFFLKDENIAVKDIKSQSWYFIEYNFDPSIQSMLAAMESMETILNNPNFLDPDWYRFGYFLCHNVRFIFYDMGSRLEGEETFVIINTKGEPLSTTENLKPLFFVKYLDKGKDICAVWEKWETYFWKHRANDNDTADAGMKEFFRWIMLLHCICTNNYQNNSDYEKMRQTGDYFFDIDNIELSDIKKYFSAVERLFAPAPYGVFSNEQDQKLLSPKEYDIQGNPTTNQNDWYRLLPVLRYLYKYPKATDIELKRVHHFFSYTSRVMNVAKSIRELLPEAVKSVESMTKPDILTMQLNGSAIIFTPEVKEKFNLCPKNEPDRKKYEEALWKAEDDVYWMASILPLINWAKHRSGSFDIDDFILYRDTFKRLLELDDSELDLFRRCFRDMGAPDYPCAITVFGRKSWVNLCFGSKDSIIQWREIIEHNSDDFRSMLFQLTTVNKGKREPMLKKDMIAYMKNKLKSSTSQDPFVTEPRLLEQCSSRFVRRVGTHYQLVQNKRGTVTYVDSYLWYLFVHDVQPAYPNKWKLVNYSWDADATVFESDATSNPVRMVIEVAWSPSGYNISLFSRDDKQTQNLCSAKAGNNGMTLVDGKYSILQPLSVTKHNLLIFVLNLMQ